MHADRSTLLFAVSRVNASLFPPSIDISKCVPVVEHGIRVMYGNEHSTSGSACPHVSMLVCCTHAQAEAKESSYQVSGSSTWVCE
jgi:hypothetical protein